MAETAEATCRRELELEIPAEDVSKEMERVAKEFARLANVPGFRKGKAPLTLIRKRFAEDIKGEVLQALVPHKLETAVNEQRLQPVGRPSVEKLDFNEGQPLKFTAVFEVLPEFELGKYKELTLELPPMEVTEADVDKALEEARERAATFTPVEGRVVADGDYAQLKLVGTPTDGGEPLQAESVLCHIGSEETMAPFNENLRGASAGEHKAFDVEYPGDYPDPKLAGKTFHYEVDVLGVKTRTLPELNDEFAKDVSDAATLEELKGKIRENQLHQLDHQVRDMKREKVLGELVKMHEFPVPEALVEQQMDVRLQRMVRQLAQQGVDPRAVNLDWMALRKRQEPRAKDDVKAELIVDRIATAENIEVTDEEVQAELEHMASHSGESAEAMRASLTKDGSLDRMKSKLRSDKTVDWLAQNAQIKIVAKPEPQEPQADAAAAGGESQS
jgi:trigger factor